MACALCLCINNFNTTTPSAIWAKSFLYVPKRDNELAGYVANKMTWSQTTFLKVYWQRLLFRSLEISHA